MGKLEKVVVLTVLFLVAVILGVSLNSDKGVADPTGPRAALGDVAQAPVEEAASSRPAGRSNRRNVEASSETPLGPAGLLSATVGEEQPDPEPQPAEVEAPPVEEEPPFITSLVGLEPSLSEDLMIYTWKRGDTFTSLAEAYYGSGLHVDRLLFANEGRRESDLVAGDRILVPVLPSVGTESSDSGPETAWAGGSTYTVQSGDVLGTISETVYGTSKSWRKIFDANRDVLANPNSLTVGTRLRIPE